MLDLQAFVQQLEGFELIRKAHAPDLSLDDPRKREHCAGVFLARGKVYFNRVCAVRIIKGKTSLSGTQWFRLNDRKRNDFGCSSTTQQLNVNLIARLSKMRRQIGKSNAASNLITVRSGRRVSHNLERSERSSSWH